MTTDSAVPLTRAARPKHRSTALAVVLLTGTLSLVGAVVTAAPADAATRSIYQCNNIAPDAPGATTALPAT